jgi:hypothetical protein
MVTMNASTRPALPSNTDMGIAAIAKLGNDCLPSEWARRFSAGVSASSSHFTSPVELSAAEALKSFDKDLSHILETLRMVVYDGDDGVSRASVRLSYSGRASCSMCSLPSPEITLTCWRRLLMQRTRLTTRGGPESSAPTWGLCIVISTTWRVQRATSTRACRARGGRETSEQSHLPSETWPTSRLPDRHFDAANEFLREVVVVFRNLEERASEALGNVEPGGRALMETGRLDEAEPMLEAALDLARRLGNGSR